MPRELKINVRLAEGVTRRLWDEVERLRGALQRDWRDPDGGPRLEVGTRTMSPTNRYTINSDLFDARQRAKSVRDSAALLAHALGVEPGEVPRAQLDAILEWVAVKLAEEGEPVAADLLRDSEVRYDAAVEFSGEEPRGFGADPYGRPSPMTHPEYWTE